MAINPAIAMGVRGIELQDPLAQYGRVAAIQQAQQQNALANMQLEEYGRARAEEEEIRNRLAGGTSLESPETRNFLLGSKTGRGILKSQDEALSARYKAAGERFGAIKAQTELQRGFLAQIDPEDPNAVSKLMAFHQGNHTGPLGEFLAQVGVKPDQGSAEIAALQGQSPEAIRAFINRSAQGVEAFNSKLMEVSPGATLVDPRTRQPVFTAPATPPTPPEVVRLQQYLGQLTPGSAEYTAVQDRIKMLTTRSEPAKTVVNLPPQQSAFEAGLGKGQATQVMENKTVAEDARSIIDTVAQGRQLLQSGVITGFGADYLTKFGAALNQAGINFAEDKVANTQAFAANMAQNVGRIIKQFGAGTGLSNADREYAEKMAGGNISLDRKALERILDINERAARNVIRLHNKNVSGIKTNIPLTVEEPPVIGAPSPTGRPSLDSIFKPK